MAGHKGRLKGAETNHRRKMERIFFHKRKGIEKMENFNKNKRDLFMVGIGLYWGEGVKSFKSGLSFVNSDPDAILIMYSGTDSPYKGGPERAAMLVNKTYPLMKERGIDTRRLRLAAICTVCTKPFLKEVKQAEKLLDGIGFVRDEMTNPVAV